MSLTLAEYFMPVIGRLHARAALLAAIVLSHSAAVQAAPATPPAPPAPVAEHRNVEIVRDTWGIAHVYGKTDADAVFGAIYAQAEDDFKRIERNYLVNLGWLAQAEGESALLSDLRQRLFVDTGVLQMQFAQSPAWLKTLMTAWADGLNHFLATHPDVTPKVITHFEPWMALCFTEGSIGGDIESVDLDALGRFYDAAPHTLPPSQAQAGAQAQAHGAPPAEFDAPPGGSNGFAIAPARSASGHALLWINPHTSYYFRSELQMVSATGLDVYGAVTWGQFFVYQGFNEHNGWMHTSYGGDAIDEYRETIVRKSDGLYYRYGTQLKKLKVSELDIPVKSAAGMEHHKFTVYHSDHGPIIRADGERWVALKILQEPVRALAQSYVRTKTVSYAAFRKTQDMRTDTSNNTVYADADGSIAYFHGNFIPRRDPRFDYTHPVDGSNPRTDWHGAHAVGETITLFNPPSGWLMNTNNWPFSAAGAASPKRENYPAYMWTKGENPRGLHAIEVLHDIHDVTLDSLIAAGYDPHLNAFDVLIPPLIKAYDKLPLKDPNRDKLQEPLTTLATWNHRTGRDSIATSMAIFWGMDLMQREAAAARAAELPAYDYTVAHATDAERIESLSAAFEKLQHDFGRWQTPWGDINRFQRRTDDIVQPFDDAAPSLPVGFAPAAWGALASFDSAKPRSTRKIYGSVGNSFICAVEFGPTVHAKALMSGGASGDPASPHFVDQAQRFADGMFRDVWFYPQDVKAHAERTYRP